MSRDVQSCSHCLRPRNPPPHPPAFGLAYEGAIGQPRLTKSLYDPLATVNNFIEDTSVVGSQKQINILELLFRSPFFIASRTLQ
jgi:hypothetical protein